jgi:hypothetical protein
MDGIEKIRKPMEPWEFKEQKRHFSRVTGYQHIAEPAGYF